MKSTGCVALAVLLASGGAAAQTPPEKGPVSEVTDLVNALLGGLLGGKDVTGAQLQEEVAEAGGLPFRQDVPVAFLGREALAAYLRELFDAEYTVEQARSRRAAAPRVRPPAGRHRPPGPAGARARGERGRASTTSGPGSGACTRSATTRRSRP